MHKMRAAFLLLATLAPQAWAHRGHGMPGETHWHATDAFGLVLVIAGAVAIAIAWWLWGDE